MAAWRYDSPGLVDRLAQGPDGTIFVVEHTGDYLYQPNNTGNAYFPYPGEKTLVILDAATGDVTVRVPLEGDAGYEPVTVGPIVSGDGFGYILVTKGREITLRRVSRDGQDASTVIVPATCTVSQCRAHTCRLAYLQSRPVARRMRHGIHCRLLRRPSGQEDFSALSTATRIEVTERGLRRISAVTDPERITAARNFIKH
ncbi:MAG: hypothetical protein Q8O42_19965 [Acidobacteriota bacterium]|nr:hypothetical protein [Acidobacteriota bacterium]